MNDSVLFAVTAANALQDAHVGVVPVIAQAGTALAPLIAVAISNTFGLLLKPRELLRVLRAKPWIILILVLIGGSGWWLWAWWTRPTPATGRVTSTLSGTSAGMATVTIAGTDWSKVALEIIRQRKLAAVAQPDAGVINPSLPIPSSATPAKSAAFYFRGGPTRSGYVSGAGPHGLTAAWEYHPEEDRLAMVLSSPAAQHGRIFGASCLLESASSYGTIFCIDAATGAQQWLSNLLDPSQQIYFGGFFSSPALTADGKNLIIGQGLHTDYDAKLVCLDAATGALRWTVPTPLHLESSPAIEGDFAVIGAGAVEQGDAHVPVGDPTGHGHPGFVLGVRISTGEVIFRETVIDPECSPVLYDGVCYIGSGMNGSRVVALRADRTDDELAAAHLSRRIWDVATPYPATGAVTLSGDLVLIGCGKGDFVFKAANPEGVVLALDAQTGATRWTAAMPDAVLGAIATAGTLAVVPCRNGEVIAIDLAAQGKVLWRARVNQQAPVLAAPAITEEFVYAVSNDGWMAIFDRHDGAQRERVYINSTERPGEMNLSTSAPVIVDGRLYVGSETGGLRCYVGSDGPSEKSGKNP